MWVLPLLQLHNWARQEKRDFSRTYRTSVVNKTRSQQLCPYLTSFNIFYLPNFAIFLWSHGNKSRRHGEAQNWVPAMPSQTAFTTVMAQIRVIILPQTLLTSLWLDGKGLTRKSKIRQGSQPSTKLDTNSSDYGNMEGDVHPFSVWDPAASSTCKECRYLGSFSQISFVSMERETPKIEHFSSLWRFPFPDQNGATGVEFKFRPRQWQNRTKQIGQFWRHWKTGKFCHHLDRGSLQGVSESWYRQESSGSLSWKRGRNTQGD